MSGAEVFKLNNYHKALLRVQQGEVMVGRLEDATCIYVSSVENGFRVQLQPKYGRQRIEYLSNFEELFNQLADGNATIFYTPGGEVHESRPNLFKRLINRLADCQKGRR